MKPTSNQHPLTDEQKRQADAWTEKVRREYEEQKAAKTNFDALIFYPHDLEGKQVELDAEAFEVINAWGQVPEMLKTALVTIVRIYCLTASEMEAIQ